MRNIIILLGLLITSTSINAQQLKKNAKISMEVDGVCMMCKNRIEKAALNTKGVKYANWNVKTHELIVIMDERKTNSKTVCENLANAGHDSKLAKAPQEAYDNLHYCCKYRDEEIVKEH